MPEDFEGARQEGPGIEEAFRDIDGDLNIFALANGLDLKKNESGGPDRTLEWFRDGLDRRIVIATAAGGSAGYDVRVEAWRRKDGIRHATHRTIRQAAAFQEIRMGLRPLLAELIEAANGLAEDDLAEEGP
jgi:hypothetical protein